MSQFDELPEGWVKATLGELGNWSSGGTPSRKHSEYYEGDIPWVKTGDLTDGVIEKVDESITGKGLKNSSAKIFPKDSLLVAMYGATIGKLGILKQPAATNQACAALLSEGLTEKLIPFAFYYLLSSREDLRKIGQGGAQPNISQTILKEYACPLPPLNEQRRIVEKIEALTARSRKARAALDEIPALLDQFRQSVLAAAFRGDLTADWRTQNPDVEPAEALLERIRVERRKRWEEAEFEKMKANSKESKNDKWKEKYKEPQLIDEINLPVIPNTWIWVALPELGELNRGKSKHRPRNDKSLFGGDYPFIQTGDIGASNGVIRDYTQTYNEKGLLQSRLWPKGTLCITIAANIAETGILSFDACFPDSVVGFLSDFEYCDIRYIEYFMRTAKDDLDRFAPSTAQKNINLEVLRTVAVPLPPRKEQQVIVEKIDHYFAVLRSLVKMLESNRDDIQFLDQSILAKAFRGELVPQDPNDEPAAVLLDRIRAERGR